MKKFLFLSCALVCLFAAGAAHAQNIKVGTIDMQKIFNAYYKTKDASVHIEAERAAAEKELHDREDAYKDTMDQIKRLNDELQNPGLSDAKRGDITKIREEKINEFKNLDREIQEFRATREKELEQESVRKRSEIVADIMKLVNAKAKSDNYDYVFDRSGLNLSGVPTVIFARDAVDFSDEIIKQLAATKPKDSGTATPEPAASTPQPTDRSKNP